MDEAISSIAAIPTIISGLIVPGSKGFEVNLSVKKYFGDVTKKSTLLWRSTDLTACSPVEIGPEVKFRKFSPCGAVFLLGKSEKSGEKTNHTIEIWRNGAYTASINASLVHDDFLIDESLGRYSWSPSGRFLVYVAEKKKADLKGTDKFKHNENFGEKLSNFQTPLLCCLDVEKMEVRVLNISYEDQHATVYPFQPIFSDEETVYFTGVRVGSRKLGLSYIYCRPSSIYSVKILDENLKATCISDMEKSCRSPISSHDGNFIVYLSNTVGRSHFKCSQLILYDVRSASFKVVVDVVKSPQSGDAFPGIFTTHLPSQRFVDAVILSTCWNDLKPLISVDLKTAQIENLIPEFSGCLRVLDSFSEKFLIAGATALHPGHLFLLDREKGSVEKQQIPVFDENQSLHNLSGDLKSSVFHVNDKVHVVIVEPKVADDRLPLIVSPHGGPNSVYSVDYVMYPIVLAKLGYAFASINYTGSIGFGDDSIEGLEGNIGVLDVEDCYNSLKRLLEDGNYDKENVFVMGGSHGGYLTAFLSAKYPECFRGAILRNPVIDLPSMMVTTDITDWPLGQLGVDYDNLDIRVSSSEEISLLRERSPSSYADSVKCPTLIMLGALDLRVPPSQGLYWANLIKSRGVDCQIYMYPDANHGLDSVESERFGMEAIYSFLSKNRK